MDFRQLNPNYYAQQMQNRLTAQVMAGQPVSMPSFGSSGSTARVGGTATTSTSTAQPPANPGGATNTTTAQDAAAAAAAAQRQANIDFVNRSFDVKLAGLQSQLDSLGAQQGAGERNINNQYGTKDVRLAEDRAVGLKNLASSMQQVQDSRARGLKGLADQMRQKSMSYNNQLGAMGAGDSSASQLLNFALGQQASGARGDLVRNASGQEVAINNQQADLERSYQRNKQDLDQWKQDSLAELANKFAEIKNQIANQMADANLSRQQQLAQYDAGVTQAAINQLSNIENMYRQQSADLTNRFSSMYAPTSIQVDPNLQQYNVQPISVGQLAGMSMPQAVNPEAAQQAILRKRLEEQQVTGA